MASWNERAENSRQAALGAFERIARALPGLDMHVELDPEHVDATADLPAQPGLDFPVHLNLQNIDELHLVAGGFWLSWFPCTDPAVVDRYVDSVVHLVRGTYRVLEYRRGARVVRADLQIPDGAGGWRRIGRHDSFSLFPWPRVTHSVLQNRAYEAPDGP